MFKKMIKKRIIIGSVALLVLLITYLFPSNIQNNINETITYVEPTKSTIYLLNEDEMVSRIKILDKNSSNIIEKSKYIIECLTIDSECSKYNPSGFKGVIPKNTKINNIDLIDETLKIDFSKELLKVSKENEEKLIEALTYSLTEANEINNIMIFVDSSILTELPNSHKKIPEILDRSFGINKIYEINDIKSTTKTTIYYLSENDNIKYYIPVTFINNDQKNKIEIIIEKLKSSPSTSGNLMSYLASSAELLDYEIEENIISLTFNNYIFNEFEENDILEEVKYSIGLSIKDNYNAEKMVFKVDNKKILDFELNFT